MIRTIAYLLFVSIFYWVLIRWLLRRARRPNTIGIFHLYCSSGGGGERVLWHTVKLLLEQYPKKTVYIYTHKSIGQDSLQILLKARDLFKIDLLADERSFERLEFISLSLSPLVETKRFPFLTLLLQNLMSIVVAFQAAYNLVPDVYMETIGFTFTVPVFKLAGCKVLTYVHYPIISNDMILNVQTSKHASFNNRKIFVKSRLLRYAKLAYYKILARLYGFAGRRADLVLVNSSWTHNHIRLLWACDARVVYPPCDIESFKSLSSERLEDRPHSESLNIISIAQFRPEKNHQLQIEAFDMFVNATGHTNDSTLTLYGGCRDVEDQKRVAYLRDLIGRLELSSRVSLVVNATFDELLEGVAGADVAIHSMANEHFGIVLLEFMAAGLITLAHNSGGPKADIIDTGRNGFLCDDAGDFADTLTRVSKMSAQERQALRTGAVKKSEQFSVQVFEDSLRATLKELM